MIEKYITDKVQEYLISIGFSKTCTMMATSGVADFYRKTVCNSKDPFKECCDFAGKIAEQYSEIKYKSPKAKTKPRKKRPPSAFNF